MFKDYLESADTLSLMDILKNNPSLVSADKSFISVHFDTSLFFRLYDIAKLHDLDINDVIIFILDRFATSYEFQKAEQKYLDVL